MPFKKELFRKLLHLPGLFFLFLSKEHFLLSVFLLTLLIFLYFASWFLEHSKKAHGIFAVSHLTRFFKRSTSFDWGPPALALGILLSLLLFDYHVAALGILQVCIADGVASLAGKKWGRTKIFYSKNKSYLGSFCFFVAAFFIQLPFIPLPFSLLLALWGTFLESLPNKGFDNLMVPVGVGLVAQFLI